ncbi:MAG: TSUP family transporter [Candidatus Actinomarina sp.]
MIKLFLIGLIGGLLSGILGIGGGIVFVPLLTYFTKEDFKINTGISSLAIVFVASASAVSYLMNGIEISSYVLYLIIGAVIGGYLGSRISKLITSKNLQRMFSVLLLFAAYRMFFGTNFSSRFEENILLYILIGILSGLGSGLLGIGGGIIRIPLLIFFGGIGNLAAQGVSLITAIPSSVAAVIPKLRDREFIKRGIIIGIFGIVGSIIGSNIAFALPQKTLNYAFATFLVLVSINMFLKKD